MKIQIPNKGSDKKVATLQGTVALGAMFVTGFVLIGAQLNLQDFALQCEVSLSQASLALLFMAAGAGLGSVGSAPILQLVDSHMVLLGGLVTLTTVLGVVCATNSIHYLFFVYLLVGISISIEQSAVILILRENFLHESGPWLQATNVFQQLGGLTLPLLNLTSSIQVSYAFGFSISMVVMISACVVKLASIQKTNGTENTEEEIHHGKQISVADLIVALATFFILSALVETMTYFQAFIDNSPLRGKINPIEGIFVLFGFILASAVPATKLQQFATTNRLISVLAFFLVGAAGSCLLPICAPDSIICMWMFLASFGFFWGPLFGLLAGVWVDHSEEPTPNAAALVTFGMMCGPNVYAIGVYFLWDTLENPNTLFWANIVAVLLALSMVAILAVLPSPVKELYDDKLDRENSGLISNASEGSVKTQISIYSAHTSRCLRNQVAPRFVRSRIHSLNLS